MTLPVVDPSAGVGDEEHVLGALPEGGNLGVLQAHPAIRERPADGRQQPRSIAGDDLHDGACVARVIAEFDPCRRLKMA